jgi:hypothetical protein
MPTGQSIQEFEHTFSHLALVEPCVQQADLIHRDPSSSNVTQKVQTFIDEVQRQSEKRTATLALKKTQLRERQRSERAAQQRAQQSRQNDEAKTRAGRFRRGLRGVWDWLIGKSKETKRQNEREAKLAVQRDRDEREAMIKKQLSSALQHSGRNHRSKARSRRTDF